MANEITNIHNDLIDLPLRKFNSSEIDILTALCYKCNEKQTNEVVLSLNEIKELSHYKKKDNIQFLETLKETNAKLMALNFTIGTTKEFIQFVLFPTFEVSESKGTLTVQVHEKFAYLLNNLTNCYTSLELKESTTLKSSYSKGIYKKLRKFRNNEKPFWKVMLKDFREYLNIPDSYKISDINKVVLKPAINELSMYFKNLKVTPFFYYKEGQRGRPKIIGYTFSFSSEIKEHKLKEEPTQENIAKITDWKLTDRFCPNCKRPMYSKLLENENGAYTLYGHSDWKTGICDYTTTDYANLLQEYQITENNELTLEEKENKSKISNLLKKLFN